MMSPLEHASQVASLVAAFRGALGARIASVAEFSAGSGPEQLAARVIRQTFEDGIGVLGHFLGRLQSDLEALGAWQPALNPATSGAPATAPLSPDPVSPSSAPTGGAPPTLVDLRGALLVLVEQRRFNEMSAFSATDIALWRALPGRVLGAANGSLAPLTEAEREEILRLSKLDRIEAYASRLREIIRSADDGALDAIDIESGWPS